MKRAAIAAAVLAGVGITALVSIRVFLIGVSVIPQNGMYPTLPKGSVVFSWKRPYSRIADVERGDIVLFKRAQDGRTYLYIWRVIGLPGDTVRAAGDSLSVNGIEVRREAVRDEGAVAIFQEGVGSRAYDIAIAKAPSHVPPEREVLVGPDELFVLGDNRYDAVDSRYFGPIKFSSVVGRRL